MLPRLMSDKNRFAKLKFCLFDVLIAPTYTKHPDSFYRELATQEKFATPLHTTSSMFDYFCFEFQGMNASENKR